MWQCPVTVEDRQRSKVRLILPALPANKSLLGSRSKLQPNKFPRLEEAISCTMGEDISQIPAATRCTMRHLSHRHAEVGLWQAQISESVGRVEREITALEQVKDAADRCLQEKQLYSQLMRDCVAVSTGPSSPVTRHDSVLTELKKEEQMTNDIRELLQKQICTLLDKLSSLKAVHAQLLLDFQDKGEAVGLTAKCIAHDLGARSSRLPAGQYKPNHVRYDKWLSHCKDLKVTADDLINDSASFRGNLRFTLANIKNAHDCQRRSTGEALRRKINDLKKVHAMMSWEKQQMRDDISDVTADIQRVLGQIRNCDSRLHQATHRLDMLNQRPRHELCMDQAYISITLEKRDLAKMSAGLRPVLMRSQQNLELTRRRLMILEDKLVKNAQALEVEQRCQNLHQNFLPGLDTTVVLANKPRATQALTPTNSRVW